MKYRHELKHEINFEDMIILRSRLPKIMERDRHSLNGLYKTKTLYFDTPFDTALREKQDGVGKREKFRIRYYNNDTSFISLEKKSKINGLCQKESAVISEFELRRILNNDIKWMKENSEAVVKELYYKIQSKLLKPKTIVEYTREAFVFGPGNVRVTLDYDIRSGIFTSGFLNESLVTLPIPYSPIILEVKWDEFCPDIIKNAVSLTSRMASAFSKYEKCRIYG